MSDLIPFNKKETTEEEETRYRRLLLIVVIIVIMIAIILTLGWFYMQKQRKEEEIRKQEEERRKKEEREKKLRRLEEIEVKIQELQTIKERLKRREKKMKLGMRIGIGVVLVAINCLYKYYCIYPFHFENDIGKLLNLNATILTCYSFLAFITFGTINNFVKEMKAILSEQLKKKHLHSLAELESLIREKVELKKELEIF
ncbi:MAG: hypothetical protein ACXVDZ_16980 [Bacteroidia bacterium]